MASQDSRARRGTQRAVAAGPGPGLDALCWAAMLAGSLTALMLALAPQGDEAAAPQGLTIVVALIAGLGLGLAGAFGLEFLYQTYHFATDIERELELPVLGLISDIRAS